MNMIADETKTLTEEEFAVLTGDQQAPAAPPAEETDPEKLKKIARKPPKEGPCKRCGQDRPLNRLMLCYSCWVKTELEKTGWREGMPHPDWCHCEGIKDHQRKSDGN
jgi:hypothetical protein